MVNITVLGPKCPDPTSKINRSTVPVMLKFAFLRQILNVLIGKGKNPDPPKRPGSGASTKPVPYLKNSTFHSLKRHQSEGCIFSACFLCPLKGTVLYPVSNGSDKM
jgi:hypothetical protein